MLRKQHLSLLAAWALAFGCALGWDSYVLPWDTFLPKAGPVGTIIGLLVGAMAMAVVAVNYGFMIRRCPGPGGIYAYATRNFGADHGFLGAWFLCFTYVAITWMDAAVLAYFVQHVWGFKFHFSAHYTVAGYEVCIVHILISSAAIAIAAAVCCRRRLAGQAQTVLALAFVAGIVASFVAAAARHVGGLESMGPAFAMDGGRPIWQVLGIVALAPWLFVGFESISHSSAEFRFPREKSLGVMVSAIVAALCAYALLLLIPVMVPYLAGGNWAEAVANLDMPQDVAFGTVGRCLGHGVGRLVVSATAFAAIFTNLIGNTVAASRLLAAMAEDGAMPPWLGRENSDGAPRNAILAISCISIPVFALGQTVIGIVVDIALLGAALAYAYTSAAAAHVARAEGDRFHFATGLFGTLLSGAIILHIILSGFLTGHVHMATESYFVLIVWCIVGLLTFLYVFRRDNYRRFGRTPVVWLSLFAAVIVLSVMWIRQITYETTERIFVDVVNRHDAVCHSDHGADGYDRLHHETDVREGIFKGLAPLNRAILRNSYAQTGITVLALVLMLTLFYVRRRREKDIDRERANAKDLFFATVSHDIRTPLNAILGFSELLRNGCETEEERKDALDSIMVSGKTLLGLVNDILDLSKLESGRMDIVPSPTDCPQLLRELTETFGAAADKRRLKLFCHIGVMPPLMLDQQRIRQIVFNLVGNALKFTEAGHVELRATFERKGASSSGVFRLDVEDTGCGISDEDRERLASPYTQVGPRTLRNGGTGLGLAICKQLAMAMGGRLEITSTLGVGSTFSIILPDVKVADIPTAEDQVVADEARVAPAAGHAVDSHRPHRVLIADDSSINLAVLASLLRHVGDFDIVTAADGRIALDILQTPDAKPFDLVLTDIWMPNFNGEDLLKAIRSNPTLSSLRVIAVTANVMLRGKAADMGFDDILLKPLNAAMLSDAILGQGKK